METNGQYIYFLSTIQFNSLSAIKIVITLFWRHSGTKPNNFTGSSDGRFVQRAV